MRFWREGPAENYEQYLFTGVTVVLLALAGLALFFIRRTRAQVSADRAPILFYVAATLLMWVLALGPGGEGHEPASLARPYSWLLALPGFNGLRVSARFAMVGTLCLAVAASLAVAHLSKLMAFAGPLARARRRGRHRWARGRWDDTPGPGGPTAREDDPPRLATSSGDGVANRQHRHQGRSHVSFDIPPPAARQRLLRATFPRTTSSCRSRSGAATYRDSSTWPGGVRSSSS